jgi:O-antigen ligase
LLPRDLAERLLVGLGAFGYPRAAVLRFIEDDPSRPMRAIGTSVDPNVFGGMLAFIGGLIVPQLFVPGSWRRLGLAWGLLGVVGVALLLTFSRSSMFGLAAALAALGLLRHRRLLWLLLAGVLLVLLLPPTRVYVQHFLEGVRGEDLATQMRFGEYKDALILISRYPWLGVGFTGVPDVDIYLGVSSVYLLIAEETGLVGLSLFLATLLGFFAYAWPRTALARRGDPHLEALILGTETAVLAGMIAGVLDHYLFNLAFPHASALLWTTVALGVTGAHLAEVRFGSSQAGVLA